MALFRPSLIATAEWKKCLVAARLSRRESTSTTTRSPSRLIRQNGRGTPSTDTTVEILHKRPAALASPLPASQAPHRHTTITEHMPSAPPPAMCRVDADAHDAASREDRPVHDPRLVEAIMKAEAPTPSRASALCLGIMRLEKSYWPRSGLEAACRRGQRHRCDELRLHRLDPEAWARQKPTYRKMPRTARPIRHANIRGRGYYH